MKKYKLFILGMCCVMLFWGCAAEKIDLPAEKELVSQNISDFFSAFEKKDFDRLSELFAHDTDMVIFGTDERERWAGWEACKEAILKQFEAFSNIRIRTNNVVVHISPTGKTAWFSLHRFIAITPKDGEEKEMKTRVTGVWEKRDGSWKLVQYHSSYPFTNWELFRY